MAELKNKKDILEKIDSIKEVLETMPVNNDKNKEKCISKIQELKKEYSKYQDKLLEQMEKRYSDLVDIKPADEIKVFEGRIETIEGILHLIKDEMTSYEKMELDKNIYRIDKFYEDNLENINNQIQECLLKFEKVGIELKVEDFNYSIYTKEYMTTFFEEMRNGTLDSDNMKNKFEEIYWKCPDIITHIELNIRSLYLNNKNNIDKYFEKSKQVMIAQWEKEPKEIWKTYIDLKKQKIEKEAIDKKILIDKFIKNKLNPKDYTDEKITEKCKTILPLEELNDFEEVKQNVFKFISTINEYKNAAKFEFIIKDIKTIYEAKGKYKKACQDTKKKIIKIEKKIKKYTNPTGFFAKKNVSKEKLIKQNTMILEVKELYKQLEEQEFASNLEMKINDNASIKSVLLFANTHYVYITSCLIKNEPEITQEQIDENIEKLNKFLINPYHTIINNICFTQEKDIITVIKDRYKLMNFKIEKEDLEIDNIDTLLDTLKQIQMKYNLEDAGIKVEELEEITELKKVLKK